jgi:hypothetical protein
MMNLGTLITFTDEQRNEFKRFCRCSHMARPWPQAASDRTLKNEALHKYAAI